MAQPTAATHPHLMAAGETTPGIARSEYAERREAFARRLPEGALALFSSSAQGFMSHDVPYPFVQGSDLFYLSGFQEHSSLLACLKPRGAAPRWRMFVQPACPKQAVWDGPRAGVEGAAEHILPEGEVQPLDAAARTLRSELGGLDALFLDQKANPPLAAGLAPLLEACAERKVAVRSANQLVQQLRVRKSAAEAALMRRSGRLCTDAFGATMRYVT